MTDMRRVGTVLAVALAWMAVCGPAVADTTVVADLRGINGSGVRGSATLTGNNDGSLTVVVRGTGFIPDQPHAQHIHGSFGGEHFTCPTMENDRNGFTEWRLPLRAVATAAGTDCTASSWDIARLQPRFTGGNRGGSEPVAGGDDG